MNALVTPPPASWSSPQRAAVWAALSAISDPEIPVISLAELGILREVHVAEDGVTEVVITPTYSGCPAMGQIEDDVRATLEAMGITARVITRLAPAWTTDWMSDEAKEKLRAYGIAPPTRASAGSGCAPRPQALRFSRRQRVVDTVPCPRCASTQTTEITAFGSTACKAQYRCLSCMEPFDYFKPY